MLQPAQSAPAADGSLPAELVEVGRYATVDEGFEHGLVILAAGRGFWVIPAGPEYRLLVEPEEVPHLQEQLRKYDRERLGWPPAPPHEPHRPWRIGTPLLWSLVVLAVYWAEVIHPSWVAAAELDRDAVISRGEWWRTFTALFLHADVAHVAANVCSGVFVFATVLSVFGRARGWLLLLISAVVGNGLSVLLQNDNPYHSVGASTAVFAGIGLLTGRALRRMSRPGGPSRWRAMATPLAAGGTVLALYGAGGAHIDVGAHLTGFVSGLVAGVFVPPAIPSSAPR